MKQEEYIDDRGHTILRTTFEDSHKFEESGASPCSALPETLRNESGGGFGFVCIWRADDKGDHARKCTVEKWLSKPENFGGEWIIDGGWGGPPGPIKVRWDGEKWQNLGFPPWEPLAERPR